MEQKTVFITGATGLLGSYLALDFLRNGCKVYALARGRNKSAQERVLETLRFWDERRSPGSNLEVIEGDITELNIRAFEKVIQDAQVIFHCAALAKIRAPLEAIRKINVSGTKNILELALKCKKLEKFNHVSTAYISGTKGDFDFDENMLDIGQGFHNTYEQTKFEAELLLGGYRRNGLKISVFRPSMIMGAAVTGKTLDFRLFYEPLHIFSKQIYLEFPANLNCYQNFINIDTVAKAISLLGMEKEDGTYHIVSPKNNALKLFVDTAREYFGFRMPEFIPVEHFNFWQLTPVQKRLIEPYISYFNYKTRFKSLQTQERLAKYGFKYPEINKENLYSIFEYCDRMGFIRKKR